jgi:hypothetical protein
MRIVVTLAALLALPFAVHAEEDSTGADAPAVVSSAPASSDSDTSVYHLEHARANQLIGRVKSLIKQIASCTNDEDVADLPASLVLLPTTSDDSIVAICPRAHAALVKHAIQSCDALKQYAVKVQLFEVSDSGKTIPVGAPHLLIGREGAVQCSTPEESVSVNFKVDTPLASSTSPVPPSPSDAEDEASTSTHTSDVCAIAGHCRLEDAPAIGEMSVGSECSGTSCSRCQGSCAGCKSGQGCSGTCCESCGCGTHESTSVTSTGECCSGHCNSSACKCDGSCCAGHESAEAGHESAEKCQETTNYEETLMAYPPSRFCNHFSVGFGFGNAPLIGPIVWFNRGAEPRCAASECQTGACGTAAACCEADSCESGTSSFDEDVPRAPAAPNFQFFVTPGGGPVILHRMPASACGELSCKGCQIVLQGRISKVKGSLSNDHVALQAADLPCSSCTDGCPAASICGEQLQATWNAPCSCETQDECESAHAEPPALLTLSQHKDPSTNLSETVVFPQWQQQFLKAFRGRSLSELFEPQAGQTPSGHELGRLLAEIPKHGTSSSTSHGGHSLTVVDLPDRVRIFESDFTSGPEKLSDATRAPINCCPNCREEFRAFLEEMFKGSNASEEIAQTSHHEGDCKGCESARDLPHVTHSKIATTEVTYPLRDLVLCDDDGRPVFDTCTIIDHLQSAVAPESWSHPSVSIQLDQQSVSLVINQTAEVHQKVADHLRYLRRLQIKQICNLIERMSGDMDESAEPSAQTEPAAPTSDVELGLGLPIGR